jgi:hypothetical protein
VGKKEKNIWFSKENGVWRIRKNQLMNLYRETDIVSEIRKGSLGWLVLVERMSEESTVKKIFKSTPEEKASVGNSAIFCDVTLR